MSSPDAPRSLAERVEAAAARLADRLPARIKVLLSGEPPVILDGQALDPQVQLIRATRRRQHVPALCEPDLATARARYRRDNLVFRGAPPAMRTVRSLTVDGAGGPLPSRLYVPRVGAEPGALLVDLHGGGFVIGDLETHDAPCRILADRSGARVLAVGYRLAPEHPHPAALRDAVAAVRWAREHAAELGVAVHRIAVGGDSAGGNLAAVVALEESRAGRPPLLQLLIYPATDASSARPSRALFGEGAFFLTARDEDDFMHHYVDASGSSRLDPCVSPLLARDHAGSPPAIVVTAGFDVLRDQGIAYADALEAAGVRTARRHFTSLPHGFLHMTGVSRSCRAAVESVADEIRDFLNAGERAA